MNFFQRVKEAIYSPAFYAQIPQKSWGATFGYFFLLILAVTLIQVVFLIKPFFVELPSQANQWIDQAVKSYPYELEIKFTNGQVTTNVTEPYFIPMSDKDVATTSSDYQNLIVIDTKTPFSQSQFESYKAIAWLNKDSLFYNDRNGARAYDLSKVKDFKIDKNFVDDVASKINPWLVWIGPVLMIFALFGLYLFYSFKLIQLLIIALLIMLLSKFFKWGLGYKLSYKTGVYAITLGLLVELVLSSTNTFTHFSGFPFMFTLITLGVVFVNLNASENRQNN